MADRIGWKRGDLGPAERLADARRAARDGDLQAKAWLNTASQELRRDRATVLARVEASALIDEWLNDAPDALSRSLPTMRRTANVVDDPQLDPLADAIESRDRKRVLDTLAALADEIGAKRIGGDPNLGPGQIVTFDRRLHDSIDGSLRPGQKVALVAPGYTTTDPDGADIVLVKAKVEEATPEEIRRASQ